MKLKLHWIGLALLAGCQSAPPSEKTQPDTTSAISTPSKQDTKPAEIKSIEKPELTPQEQEDVWQRIAMQLNMPIPDHKSVDYYRNWYIKHPSHLRTVAKRAQPFLYMITVEIEKRGLPMELVLLPIVESAFDPFAYSHGSAAGLWQFVPGTADRFKLERNWWYDGRRDVPAATNAALDYMEYFDRRFDGNWQQAIASYNSGGGRVSRAIRKNKNLGKPTDFFSLDLPEETSGYVPKLLALADIIKNHEKYGVELPPIANKPVLEMVDPNKQLDLAIAAEFAGISISELQGYNPGYNQWATSPDGPYHLLLPIDKVDRFNANLKKNGNKTMKVVRYKVQSGDTISQLAVKHNTTSSIIEQTNDLNGTSIRVDQYLLIPTASQGNKTYALSAPQRLKKTQAKAKGKYKSDHTVKDGESLWSIARDNSISYRDLAKWNGMAPKDSLRVGQKLVIWKSNSDGGIIRTVHYQIRQGDNLSSIAQKFSVSVTDIMKWNSIERGSYIKPGQKLKLYFDVTKANV
ncbi:LysM peptidoglycan-binding domain-containing protein [Aliivibrio salmonicida]|uniref:Membrane-bound lytic murein transglycosylase D n=1 Tax=Aliivibrio salmonicida (strain LFI1238) TaxID=316275 RepID=B6EJV5_ALISL|nr:LysM peptidoglycan-binding domain-containing protein [Aliivibrio salmonicida]AZL85531.1 LysM peptidoglycan-binding domain-containing protein [Aliivibrio salmonicida]CAQ80086.1 membrane-bound lytic murein transglycosylase D precursor [Aliivibrio salmonicida LFI1238]